MPSKPPHPPQTQQFNQEIQILLSPKNPHARSLLAFIYREIRQFHLQGRISEVDIFIEAYMRGVDYTRATGNSIQRPKAWMRRTAYNIIREYSRNQQRYRQVAFDELVENQMAGLPHWETCLETGGVDGEIRVVLEAIAALSPEDCQLIQLRVIEGLSWQQVGEILRSLGHPPTSRATLRKRGQRALERLRVEYHRRHPPQDRQN